MTDVLTSSACFSFLFFKKTPKKHSSKIGGGRLLHQRSVDHWLAKEVRHRRDSLPLQETVRRTRVLGGAGSDHWKPGGHGNQKHFIGLSAFPGTRNVSKQFATGLQSWPSTWRGKLNFQQCVATDIFFCFYWQELSSAGHWNYAKHSSYSGHCRSALWSYVVLCEISLFFIF